MNDAIDDASLRAQAAHRRAEESLARAQRLAHLGSWEWDLRTNEVFRSAELYRLFGVAPADVTSRPWSLSEALFPEERDEVEGTIRNAVEQGLCYSFEHRILRKGGGERIVLHQGEPVIEGDRVVGFTGTMLDITERKRAERELEAAMRRLSTIVEECPVGISIYDAHGNRTVNSRGKEILGQTGEQPLDRYQGRTLLPDGTVIPVDQTPGPRALRGERVAPMEIAIRRVDGTTVPIKISATPLHGADGEAQGAVVVYDDITAEKALERLHAEWGSVVAHDLRQPLNAIHLHAQILARAQDRPGAVEKSATEIRGAARRLDSMIRDLMDISRLESHRVTLSRDALDVAAHVRAASEPLGLAEPERPIEVNVHGDIPLVHADSERLSQILENLLTNAVKYGDPGTPIVVEVSRGESVVEVAVTNRGPGIHPDDMPRIFERFQRTQAATASHVKGVGLGLYIVRQLVEAHGGWVTAHSRPGEHTTFRFALPVVANA